MARYTWKCCECHHEEDRNVPSDQRDWPYACPKCLGKTIRQFPVEAALGVKFFAPYWDEGLNCDVNSESERKSIMRALNVIEAGDPVHGGRNFEKKAPHHVKPRPLRGEPFQDPRLVKADPFVVGVEKNGKTEFTTADKLKSV